MSLEKPKYSTEELANLMIEKGMEMEKSPLKNTLRPASPQRKGYSRANSRTVPEAASRATS
jgi:hypothetical protein